MLLRQSLLVDKPMDDMLYEMQFKGYRPLSTLTVNTGTEPSSLLISQENRFASVLTRLPAMEANFLFRAIAVQSEALSALSHTIA